MNTFSGSKLCDVCAGDTNKLKGGHIIDGDNPGYLSFLCPPCYKISYGIYENIKSTKYIDMASSDGAKYIMSRPSGPLCLRILHSLTENWKTEYFLLSFYRLLLAFVSGLDEHPEIKRSYFNITFALTHGIGFPCEKRTTIFYTLNNDMTTTANAILFRRTTKKNIVLTTNKHKITSEIIDSFLCTHCMKDGSTLLCNRCKGMYFCSERCMILGKDNHNIACSEVYNMDNRLKTEEVEKKWSPKGKKQRRV